MLFTVAGIFILSISVLVNAAAPILSRALGRSIDVILTDAYPLSLIVKALSPIALTVTPAIVSGMTTSVGLNEKEFPYVDFLTECILQAKNDQEEINLIRQFIVLCSNHIPANTDRSEKRPDWFNDFLLRVNDPKNFSQPVNQLYRYVNYSSSMLSILFKKYMNMTLVQYFTDVKIKYACNLLRNTNYSTLSTANDIGFFSLSHFNHVFKEHVHLTPAQYRQSYQPKDKRKLH